MEDNQVYTKTPGSKRILLTDSRTGAKFEVDPEKIRHRERQRHETELIIGGDNISTNVRHVKKTPGEIDALTVAAKPHQ
jgi:hypothetical protein